MQLEHSLTVFRVFDPPVRRYFSDVFPYAVLYLDQPDRVWIIADAHEAPTWILARKIRVNWNPGV